MRFAMLRRIWIGIVMGLALALTAPGKVSATSSQLQEGLAKIAKEILASTKDQPVSVGSFTPTKLPFSNAGTGIEEILKGELEQLHKGIVTTTALYEVKGDYALVVSPTDPSLKEIKIVV